MISLLFSVVSLSQRGLGQAWDSLGQRTRNKFVTGTEKQKDGKPDSKPFILSPNGGRDKMFHLGSLPRDIIRMLWE